MAKDKLKLNEITLGTGRVNQKELTHFTRQFATLSNAGLTTIRSLDVLMKMLKPGVLRKSLKKIKGEVEQGISLSESLSHHPKCFDKLYVNMVKAGEAGGILDVILNRLADFREKSQKIVNDIKSAMMYPVSVVIIATSIVTAIIIFIIPQFQKMFEDMNLVLPEATLLLLYIADLVQNRWYIPISFMVIFILSITISRKYPKGLYYTDYAFMYIPVFGGILRKSSISRFCRTMGTLLDSGVSIVEGLSIVRHATGNEVIGVVTDDIIVAVKQGESMTKPMRLYRVFDEMTVSMLEVGDEAGEISGMMTKISDNFDNEVDALVSGMKSLIEPILIIGLGLTVGFIVVALFLPLISIMDNLSK